MKSMLKLTLRNIRSSFMRYLAILLIVMLSVGFFSGLKITRDAMAKTGGDYLTEQHFYDYRLISTLGFTEDDVQVFSEASDVQAAEGSFSTDALLTTGDTTVPFRLISLPAEINLPSLKAGRLPSEENECLGDAAYFSESDIGSELEVEGDDLPLSETTFTLVGLADSPLYLGNERGASSIGVGTLSGFLYLPEAAFETDDIYTELYVTIKNAEPPYSDAYSEQIKDKKSSMKASLRERADERFENILEENHLSEEMAEAAGIEKPETYLLTREENAGYVTFENNTSILSGIANIFPLFFILIAMLVCMTTMTRMVQEERTQIGVLKATGFGNGSIIGKYLLYAGSATLTGWAAGFFLGTFGLPQIFWRAYSSMYSFAPLKYLFSPVLAAATLLASMAGILGSTWLSCRNELKSAPAELLRPSAPQIGRKILLERLPLFWNQLSFLQKVTLRNMFRYKRRLFMMLVGISCCAGLILTAFGVRDSMTGIGTTHFEEIQHYDLQASYEKGGEEQALSELSELDGIKEALPVLSEYVDVRSMKNINLLAAKNLEDLSPFWDFHQTPGTDTGEIRLPREGEAIISQKIAQRLGLSVGDSLEMENEDHEKLKVKISGIFTCYVNNFIVLSDKTCEKSFGPFETNSALILSDVSDQEQLAKDIMALPDIAGVSQLSVTRDSIDSPMSCLDDIIWLIVLFSDALAFIVIFNLTNINLAERSREVATVEVLGFYPKETAKYILQENLILSLIGSVIGLPLGPLFHRLVMQMIDLEATAFRVYIAPKSYVSTLICTALFAVFVNFLMRRQVRKIKMAESLKAVE